jgi:hypothetical protein
MANKEKMQTEKIVKIPGKISEDEWTSSKEVGDGEGKTCW